MLSGAHFYYRTIRRNVIAFGTLFKDIQLVTYANDTAREELKRIRVPLVYGDKEDYYTRLKAAGVVPIPTDLPLPRMMFRMTRLGYDLARKQQSQLQSFAGHGVGLVHAQYVPVPYNIGFTLEIYVRNTEDGCQIVEQILPYFTPEYTLQMVFVDVMGLTKNIPIVLESVDRTLENEGASDWTMRREIWTLNFTMQTYIFGPADNGGLVTQANTNIWYYAGTQESGQSLNLSLKSPGLLTYKIGEVIYQGPSLQQATAIGYVQAFEPHANLLSVYQQSGTFTANANVKGTVSSASWNVVSMPVVVPMVTIKTTAVPPSVNLGDDFGFATVITETL